MSTKSGWQKKLSRNTATFATPTWDEMTAVQDLDVDDNFDEQDVTDRGDGGVKTFDQGLRNWSVKFNMLEDFENADFTALLSAYLARGTIEVCVHDGPMSGEDSTGTRYTRAVCKVFSKPVKEALADRVGVEFTLKPAKNAPNVPVSDGTVA